MTPDSRIISCSFLYFIQGSEFTSVVLSKKLLRIYAKDVDVHLSELEVNSLVSNILASGINLAIAQIIADLPNNVRVTDFKFHVDMLTVDVAESTEVKGSLFSSETRTFQLWFNALQKRD